MSRRDFLWWDYLCWSPGPRLHLCVHIAECICLRQETFCAHTFCEMSRNLLSFINHNFSWLSRVSKDVTSQMHPYVECGLRWWQDIFRTQSKIYYTGKNTRPFSEDYFLVYSYFPAGGTTRIFLRIRLWQMRGEALLTNSMGVQFSKQWAPLVTLAEVVNYFQHSPYPTHNFSVVIESLTHTFWNRKAHHLPAPLFFH